MGKNVYTIEIKWAVVKEIMEKYGIKNKSQIETWMRWYRANEILKKYMEMVKELKNK